MAVTEIDEVLVASTALGTHQRFELFEQGCA
jgi:hypothetical protein